jgi:hypothetical protein
VSLRAAGFDASDIIGRAAKRSTSTALLKAAALDRPGRGLLPPDRVSAG